MFKIFDVVTHDKQLGVVIDSFPHGTQTQHYCAWVDGTRSVVEQDSLRPVCHKDVIVVLRTLVSQATGRHIQSVMVDDLLPVLKQINI